MKPITPIKGFDEDLAQLIQRCQELDPLPSFTTFIQVWNNLHWDLMFAGHLQKERMHEFMDGAFLCTTTCIYEEKMLDNLAISEPLHMILDRKSLYVFVLYALYRKQPGKVHIRLTSEYLLAIRKVIAYAKSKKYSHVLYCWQWLLANGAIELVYAINFYGPWFRKRGQLPVNSFELNNSSDRKMQKQLLELSCFQRDYSKMKLNVVGAPEVQSMDLVNEDPFSEFAKKLALLKRSYETSQVDEELPQDEEEEE